MSQLGICYFYHQFISMGLAWQYGDFPDNNKHVFTLSFLLTLSLFNNCFASVNFFDSII